MKKTLYHIIITAVIAGVISALMTITILRISAQRDVQTVTPEQKIASYYDHETTVLVSPHHVRKALQSGTDDFILIDVRSPEEYEKEHIIGAVNIPAYIDKENTQKTDQERIVHDFLQVIAKHPDKDIIVYCYSHVCMTGRKIGKMLADHGIYVRELGIGWNEWRYFWKQWNYPHEWENIDPLDYVTTGSEPGEFMPEAGHRLPSPCNIDNAFGC